MRYFIYATFFLVSATCFGDEEIIAGTDITFTIPDGFTSLSQDIIDFKWPSKRGPQWVVGNESAATTIAYDLKDHDISTAPMEQLMSMFAKMFDRVVPGIEWKEKKVIEQSGKEWVYMEMTSNAVDTDIYNMMLLTNYKDKMLVFNFNSTKEQIEEYREELLESMESIRIGSE